MPVTRSARRPETSSSKDTLDNGDGASPETAESNRHEHEDDSETGSTLQALLRRALGGARHLERENEGLHKKVKALERKLERVQDADELPIKAKRSRRAAASVADLQKEVQGLRNKVRRLEKAKEKYRKRIHELSMREVKKDADELIEDAEFEVGDPAHKMRKLLREFHDLMEASVIGEDEECAICMEPLELKKCSSLPCQHVFCNRCLQRIKPDADSYRDEVESIRCPSCRTPCPRDELETVEFTSTQQWDALLDVARKWAKIDLRREEDTSEEEGEEEFIDDPNANDASTTASEHEPSNPLDTSPEPENREAEPQTPSRLRRRIADSSPEPEDASSPVGPDESAATGSGPSTGAEQPRTSPPPGEAGPSTTRQPSYSQSPRKDKRKLLERMAEARSKKPRL